MGGDEQGGGLCYDAALTEFGLEVDGQTSASIPASIMICVEELTAGPHAAHLSGLGHDLQLLRQQALDLSAAAGEYAAAHDQAAALRRISTQLKALGQSLCAVAVPDVCNNPLCRNMCGPSEAAVVGGRSCLCSGCRVARYCSRALPAPALEAPQSGVQGACGCCRCRSGWRSSVKLRVGLVVRLGTFLLFVRLSLCRPDWCLETVRRTLNVPGPEGGQEWMGLLVNCVGAA